MNDIEFYIYENNLWYLTDNGISEKVSEDSPIVSFIINVIQNHYPKAYEALCKEYSKSSRNPIYYNFLIARRFCKCNFGELDASKKDINRLGELSFEKVKCPLRGECKLEGICCNPVFNSTLSPAENRVGELMYKGLTTEEISEVLYLSQNTVKNHYKSIYSKLGIHEKSEFIKYAQKNALYGD